MSNLGPWKTGGKKESKCNCAVIAKLTTKRVLQFVFCNGWYF